MYYIILPLIFWFLNFIPFFWIARAGLPASVSISFARSLASYIYYPFLFPVSDQSSYYWPSVLQCKIEGININFYFLADLLHCKFGVDSLQVVNLFYVLAASFLICICFRSIRTFSKCSLNLSINNSAVKPWRHSFTLALLCLDPASLFYTSAFGKDFVTYVFVLSYLTFLASSRRLISFLFLILSLTSISSLSDRPYSLAILGIATFLSQYFCKFTFLPKIPFLRFSFSFAPRIKIYRFFSFVLLSLAALGLLYFIFNSYLSSKSAFDYYEQYSTNMGGALQIPAFIPVLLKPFIFLTLPLPLYPFALASLPFGLSTLVMFFIIARLFKLKYSSSGFSVLSVSVIVFLLTAIAFGFTASNFGILVRYRTIYFMPCFAVLLLLDSRISRFTDRILS